MVEILVQQLRLQQVLQVQQVLHQQLVQLLLPQHLLITIIIHLHLVMVGVELIIEVYYH